MTCSYGVISHIYDFGILSYGIENKDACSKKDDGAYCNNMLNATWVENFNKTFTTSSNYTEYTLTFPNNELWSSAYSTELSVSGNNCTDYRSYVFIQYACT